MAESSFLGEFSLRSVELPKSCQIRPVGLALGKGNIPLEVVVASSNGRPGLPALRSCWKARNAGRAAPLLLVVLYDERAALCGAVGNDPPAYVDLDPGQVERICAEALRQEDRHAALRSLRDSLPALESELAGIRNEGFLATHELIAGVRERSDWASAGEKARRVLKSADVDLLNALGFEVEKYDQMTNILRSAGRRVALAVLLKDYESPEILGGRFHEISPISYALAVADRENLPYVVIRHGLKIRVYPAKVGVGVGRRSRTETYLECHRGLLRDADASYLWLLFSAEALAEGGSLEEILDASGRFSGNLAEQLRERIYRNVVPTLATGIVEARRLRKPTISDLAQTYEMALFVLFRLLFVAYAEDKDLLPFRWNGLYRRRSLKEKALEILELLRKGMRFDEGFSLWEEVKQLFRAVENGNREWSVPAYNGKLFSTDPEVSPIGALLEEIAIPNTVLGPALRDLLLVETPEGLGPVDFRSLGVREFGTIYEGLLESELSVAETPLSVDKNGFYRPCKEDEEPIITAGQVYLHNTSGARKSTGSYFTKSFAVEHLLEAALEPALRDHLARLDSLDDDEAAERFFDFRVADIAMGSGHFLTASVDRIERAFTGYLSTRNLEGVKRELSALRQSAVRQLGPLAEQVEIEDSQLLRRLIARRCIYGVDINPIAVQLGQLAIWIHTFVPGLPLSLLDHNIVCGNSLVGIGRLAEIREMFEADESRMPLFPLDAGSLLGGAAKPLQRLAAISDMTLADIQRARSARLEALEAVAIDDWEAQRDHIADSEEHAAARDSLGELSPFHFPVAFPEVFLRERAGFDVVVGNPPWEVPTVHEVAFWARHFPGLRGLPQEDASIKRAQLKKERPDLEEAFQEEVLKTAQIRKSLTSGAFRMGAGDPDYYKAFCWRFWHLVSSEGGRIGVVLPRSALAAKGSTEFRMEIRR